MIYSICDMRYLLLAYRNCTWSGPDLSKLPTPIANILKWWEDQMTEVEICWSDGQLSDAQIRVSMDFLLHTCVRHMNLTGADDDLLELSRLNMHPTLPKEEIREYAHKQLIALATLYHKCATTYGERQTEIMFSMYLRGAVQKAENANPGSQHMDFMEMFEEFPLGVVTHFVFRPPGLTCYLPEEVIAKVHLTLEALVETAYKTRRDYFVAMRNHKPEEAPFATGLTPLPPPGPESPPATSSSASEEPEGPVRAHDKGPRAQKWAGSRQRAGDLRAAGRGRGGGGDGLPRDEGEKEASIKAGKERKKQLRDAEAARIAELVEMQKIVSIGDAIARGLD